jgi:hypothetical protein
VSRGGLAYTAWSLLGRIKKPANLFRLVDHTGIVVFVGPNGSGKSLAAVESCLRTLDGVPWECWQLGHHHARPLASHIAVCVEGCERAPGGGVAAVCDVGQDLGDLHCAGFRLVFSTVPLLDEDGQPHPLYRELSSFMQLITVEHADVLFDEVAGIADASDSGALPTSVTNWLHQLRKRDNRLRVTTPAYARCAKPIRQVAQVVVDARAFFPEPVGEGRLWRPRRGMMYRAFDAFAFDEYTATTGKRIKALASAAYWRPTGRAQSRFDTLGSVTQLGHVTEHGMCSACGGGRSRPKCACDPVVDSTPMDLLRIEEVVSPGGSRTRRAVVLGDAAPDADDQVDDVETRQSGAGVPA